MNTYGHNFRISTFGESHGPAIGVIIDGCPAGISIQEEFIQQELDRRKPGQSRITTQRQEDDTFRILSGVFEGKSTGTPIAIVIENQDQRSKDYSEIKNLYRPGHADFTFDAKYGFRDYRGGGRSSARETVCRVAAGAIARKYLASLGVRVTGYVSQVGGIRFKSEDPTKITLEQVETSPVRCPDPAFASQMIELIEQVRKERDSIGGACEIVATGEIGRAHV